MSNTALIQVLGAIAYGELKAHEGAKADAQDAATEAERRWHRQVAAEELRHHKGFVKRLEALGADPERAMAPYREPLDRYHARIPDDDLETAVFAYLGEGVADDLLQWLRTVVDPDTAIRMIREFAESVPITHFYSWTLPPGLPPHWAQTHLELFASKVIPAFR